MNPKINDLIREYPQLKSAIIDCSKRNDFEGMVNLFIILMHNYAQMNAFLCRYDTAPVSRWP